MGYPYSAQPVLVSGANIKTIGGESVLGSGDIDAVSSTDLQAALPVPIRINSGTVFVVPENKQMPFRVPIVIDGILRIDGVLYGV